MFQEGNARICCIFCQPLCLYWAKSNIPYKKTWKSFTFVLFDALPVPSLLLSLRGGGNKPPPKPNSLIPSCSYTLAKLFLKSAACFSSSWSQIVEFTKLSFCVFRVPGRGTGNISCVCWVQCRCFLSCWILVSWEISSFNLSSPEMGWPGLFPRLQWLFFNLLQSLLPLLLDFQAVL